MDIDAYISSGILENYCLGFCSGAENIEIENHAQTFPAIKKEIEKIRSSLEAYFFSNELKPSPAVKIGVMLAVYSQAARQANEFAPLINEKTDLAMLAAWVYDKKFTDPANDFENLFVIDLPSTEQVTNFIVYAKTGHETEMHNNFIEYLYIIRGSCIMDLEGEKKSYKDGEIIHIKPYSRHSATVTSDKPMMALVQRQAFA